MTLNYVKPAATAADPFWVIVLQDALSVQFDWAMGLEVLFQVRLGCVHLLQFGFLNLMFLKSEFSKSVSVGS